MQKAEKKVLIDELHQVFGRSPHAILVDFAKEHPQLVVKAGVVSGSQMLDAEGVKALSAMPSLPEMRARLLGLMQAPAARLVRLLNTPASQLARVLKAHQEKEEGAAAQS